ncbi:MAG: restriction endonuclease subunit S [Candidatus Gracilibacteria bacterium]|nr:restriction endonuclease subunit S [Candidatus Gracilibacteria bacterium]
MQNQTTIKPGYKKTHFGIIPDSWIIDKLGRVAELKVGKTPSRSNTDYWYNGNSNNIWISIRDMKSKYLYDSKEYLTNFAISTTKINKVEKGTLLMSFKLTLGKMAWAGKDLYTNEAIVAIKPYEDIILKELLYFSLPYSVSKSDAGEAVKGKTLNQELLKNLDIIVPTDINEQQKISKILNTCDDTIEITKEIIQKLESRNKGLQGQLLTGKKRISGFTDKWKLLSLKDVFNRVTRKNDNGNTNVLTISAQRGLINQENFFNKQIASVTLDNYFLLNKGEFAYNKSYSNGYPMGAIKRLNDYDKGVVTTLYICFSIKEELNYSSNFFEKYFESGLLIRGLTEIAHEGGRAHGLLNVTPTDFFNLKIKVPDEFEQEAIADVLDKSFQQLNEYKQKLEKLELQKKGLMQQLLTGKTRVKI